MGIVLAVPVCASDARAGDANSDRPRARVERDVASGRARLVVPQSRTAPIRLVVTGLCRYEPKSRRWSRDTAKPVPKAGGAGTVVEIADRTGLYWVEWTENGRSFATQVAAGPVLCNDVMLAPPTPAGMVSACVPLGNAATAAYVPDPAISCR